MKHHGRIVPVVAVVVLLAAGLAGAQQVVQQIPPDAAGFFEVKNLQELSGKMAKFAKQLGLDQIDPRFADPLKSLQDEYGVKEGLNADGDMAVCFFPPPKRAGNNAEMQPPPVAVLIPVSDYKSFLGNFENVSEAGNGVSQVTVPKDKEKLFIVNRGKYAVAAMDKKLLAKTRGLTLQHAASAEVAAKDAVLFINVPAMRPAIQQGLDEAKRQMDQAKNAPNAGAAPNPFANNPQMQKMMESYFNGIEQLIKDTRWSTVSLNLTDTGIGAAGLSEFDPQSDTGKLVAQVKNTDQSLLAGLPKATYFAYGGLKLTPQVADKLFSMFMDPMMRQAGQNAQGKELAKAIASMKQSLSATNQATGGYAAASGAPNQGFIQTVGIIHGDAQTIVNAQKSALPAMSAMMGMGDQKTTAEVKVGPARQIEGVDLTTYKINFKFDQKDPQAMQAQQAMSMMFGRGGLTGNIGAVNNNTVVQVQGGDDQFLTDAINAAKKNNDVVGQAPNVRRITQQLPKQRAMEFYLALDNIVNAGVKFAKQQGLAVQFKLPPNLPPIGFSGGTEGSTARFDLVIPTDLVRSITAAMIQLRMQMNGGPGGPGQGGGV